MTATYTIFAQHRLKYVRVSGTTHLGERRALALQYREDSLYDPDHRQLVDLSELEDAKATFSDVLTLRNFYLRTFGPLSTPIDVAILAPTDLGYGIARMFASIMLGQRLMRIKVFSNLPAATAWLGGTFPASFSNN